MPSSTTQVRVRYGEVDRMGVVYHSHYLVFFEIGRTAFFRERGATYRELEDRGTLLVVTESSIRHHRPAFYDDLLTVTTRLAGARGARVRFEYEVHRPGDAGDAEHVASGHTVLASTDRRGRPIRLPHDLKSRILEGVAAAGASKVADPHAS